MLESPAVNVRRDGGRGVGSRPSRVAGLALALASCGPASTGGSSPPAEHGERVASELSRCRCARDGACWPDRAEWQTLRDEVGGRLVEVRSPVAACAADPDGDACAQALADAQNPFLLEEEAGATQTTGWLGAWATAPSAYAVAAESTADVVAAVRFARLHQLRLVIKGTGHDYLGRSSAPDSLLVWTHAMRDVTLDDAFVPAACGDGVEPTPAVNIGAGARWGEVYRAVSVEHGRYVQGGGCTTVGAAGGFLQGGGFGSFSKAFGTAAANMLEAEIITADGSVVVANACQNEDLFWALRGGGGGTFGVVTRVTLRTHPLPAWFGAVRGEIHADDDAAFEELLGGFVRFYRDHLDEAHWGEQAHVGPGNLLRIDMLWEGFPQSEAETVWRPFRRFLAAHARRIHGDIGMLAVQGPALWDHRFLDEHVPAAIVHDSRPSAPPENFFWASNQSEVSHYLYAYQSRWLPRSLFDEAHADALAEMLFHASRHQNVELHFQKGLSGAGEETLSRARDTATNPAALSAAALVIVAGGESATFEGISGHAPNTERGAAEARDIRATMQIFRDATPDGGAYPNEADYFEPDWQRSFWGANYERLLEIKRRYDPEGLFTCHHCVGSEAWTDDGMCRAE